MTTADTPGEITSACKLYITGAETRLHTKMIEETAKREDGSTYKVDVTVGIRIEEDGPRRTTFFGGYISGDRKSVAIRAASWGSVSTEVVDTQRYSTDALQERSLEFPNPEAGDWTPVLIQVDEYLDAGGSVEGSSAAMRVGPEDNNTETIDCEVSELAALVVWAYAPIQPTVRRVLGLPRTNYNQGYCPWLQCHIAGTPAVTPKKAATKKTAPVPGLATVQGCKAHDVPPADMVSISDVNEALTGAGFQLAVVNGRVELWRKWHNGAPSSRKGPGKSRKTLDNSLENAFRAATDNRG